MHSTALIWVSDRKEKKNQHENGFFLQTKAVFCAYSGGYALCWPFGMRVSRPYPCSIIPYRARFVVTNRIQRPLDEH